MDQKLLQQIDDVTFHVIKGLYRPYFLATEGYLTSEEEFYDETDGPYVNMAYNPKNERHWQLVEQSSLRKGLTIICKFGEGLPLNENETIFMKQGYGFEHEYGDFGIEVMYPIVSYIHLKNATASNDYTQDTNHSKWLELRVMKFLTRFDMENDAWFERDFGMHMYLGFETHGFTIPQLQVMLGYTSERTARGLALKSTPKEKRIDVFTMAPMDTKSNKKRTLIKRSVFIDYIKKHTQTSSIQFEGERRSVDVKLTGGNIRNNHIYLTKVMSFFPNEFIGGSNKTMVSAQKLILDVGSDQTFQTDIVGDKKIFRNRQALKVFFQQYKLSEGDSVTIHTKDNIHFVIRPT